MSTTCVKAAHSEDQLCDQLEKLEDQQSSMLLLRHCHIPTLDHLARSVEPTLLSEAASIQDFQTWLMQLQLQEMKQGFVPFKESAQAHSCMHYQLHTDSHSPLANFACRAV